MLMGILRLLELRHYWSSELVICVPAVANLITKFKFKELTENIHCIDIGNAVPRSEAGHKHIHTLRPVISDVLNSHLKEVYTTSIVMAVGKCMVPLRCYSSMKQYVPIKPVRHGCKVWCLAYLRTEFVSSLVYIQGKKMWYAGWNKTWRTEFVSSLVYIQGKKMWYAGWNKTHSFHPAYQSSIQNDKYQMLCRYSYFC